MKSNVLLQAFNRGLLSTLALARTDLKRTALSAEIQTNFMPRVLGSMMLRPGWQYIDTTLSNAQAVHLPFIYSNTDTAIVELTNLAMRVRVNEAIITRVAVSSAVTNGTFNTDLTGWTSADQTGATSAWAVGGYMSLVGNTFNAAIRYQQITVAGGDVGKEHGLRIVVNRGSVTLRVGSTNGGDDYITETSLYVGTHSLALTPAGNFYIQLSSTAQAATLVDSVAIESAGAMQLPTVWPLAALQNVRIDQSADVIFAACNGYLQQRIERRSTRSWSVVSYHADDGPFRTQNLGPITLTPSATSGDITITASASLFRSTHVGGLFSIISNGQSVTAAISGQNQWSNPIRVVGVGASRLFNFAITGTWVGKVVIQYSVGTVGSWVTLSSNQNTANAASTYTDGLDNQIIYYRIGIDTGNYTSGTANVSLTFAAGSLTGIVRITAYTSATSVSAAVLTALGGTSASSNWAEGDWSDYRGYPTATALYEGRLWWAGRDKIWGSVSDAFGSFDATVIGDSAPISRSIGSGPVDTINFIMPLLRMILGGQGAEHSVRSTSLDEPLTPTNFNIKQPSTQGSSNVGAVKIDTRGLFVHKCGTRLFEMSMESQYSYDYQSSDLTLLCPEVGLPSFTKIAVQRQPDTRIHCLRSDGQVAVLISDPLEDVKCWIVVQTNGIVEDIAILPGTTEDKVYYTVNRTIGGVTKRYLERWALESECQGGQVNKNIDAHIVYSGVATSTITGLGHLEGQTVVAWGDGKDLGTYVVASGQITLTVPVSNAVVGLGYTAQYKSTKLAYASQLGTALTQKKRVDHIALIMLNTHYQGLKYGPDFNTLDDLPLVEDGAVTAADTVWQSYDKDSFEFNGEYSTDSRICLQAASPRPCTISAAIISMMTNDKQ
jgi:hypothetical protein